jgi:hypothetical protein
MGSIPAKGSSSRMNLGSLARSLEPKKDSADRIKDLVKAGALIVAEIERLQRAAAEASKNSPGNMKWVRLVKK